MTTPKELADKAKKLATEPNRYNTLCATIGQLQAMAEAQQATVEEVMRRLTEQESRHVSPENVRAVLRVLNSAPPSAQQSTGSGQVLTDEKIKSIAHACGSVRVMPGLIPFARAVLAAATQAQPEVEALYREVGRKMVEITTTVRDPDEWLCIPELWLQCMQERDEALRKLDTQVQPEAEALSDLSLLVARMAHRLRITEPGGVHVAGNQALADQATDYLKRKRLLSPLRAGDAAPTTGKREPLTPEKIEEIAKGSRASSLGTVWPHAFAADLQRALGITGEQR